jgi:hypothetical protein
LLRGEYLDKRENVLRKRPADHTSGAG